MFSFVVRPSRSIRPLSVILSVAVPVLCLIAGPAAEAQPPAESFGGETAVTVVEVPVQVVTRNGEPVSGLGRENFRLFDGRDEVPIDTFEMIDLATVEVDGPRAHRAVQAAARRHFLLLFDLSFTSPAQVVTAQRAARELIRSDVLHPTDLVGVAFYTSRQGLTMPLGFTTDRLELLRVIEGFGLLLGEEADVAAIRGEEGDEVQDPLNLRAGSGEAVLTEIGAAAGVKISDAELSMIAMGSTLGGPPKRIDGGAMFYQTLAQIDASQRASIKQERGAEVRAMAANYQALVEQLAGLDGKKYMVLFSGGFPSRLLGVGEFGMPESGAAQTLAAFDEMADAFRDTGWVIYTIEPRGARAQYWEESGAQSLTYLARETGGLSFQYDNDLSSALGEVLENTRITYLLTFRARGVPMDGSSRPIRVRLEGVPRGAQAVHRTSYRAPSPDDGTPAALARRAQTAALLMADDTWESLPVAVRALPQEPARPDGTSVPVVVEVGGKSLLEAPAGDAGVQVEIFSYAFDQSGRIQGFLTQALGLDSSQHGETLAAGGLKFFGQMDLPPGRYELRTLVRTPSNNLSSLVATPFEVEPGGDRSRPTLLPPVFLQGSDETWLLTRAGAADEYPFQLDGQQFIPSAKPALGAGSVARLIVPGVDLGNDGFRLETRVTAAGGRAVEGGEISFVSRSQEEATNLQKIVTTFQPVGLGPGEYELVLSLVDVDDGSREIVSAPFRVDG